MPEFIQDEATVDNITNKARAYLDNPKEYDALKTSLDLVKDHLGESGAVGRAAKEVLDFLDQTH